MKLIVGLGNPGDKYAQTRHNAGFMAVDYLQEHYDFEDFKTLDKGKSLMTKGEIAGKKVILLKPQKFMNLSGVVAQAVASYFKIKLEDIIAIYDDADIAFDTMRIRGDGSAGGHKGVKSLIEHLGGKDFVRIRLGIKPEKPFKGELEDYVLGKLTKTQKASLESTIDEVLAALETLLKEGIEVAMNRYN